MGQREAVRTRGGNANGRLTPDISVLGTRTFLIKMTKKRGLSKKVEVFDHPDIAENSYVIHKVIIYHLLKIFKIYMSKNLYIIDHCPAIREIAGLSAERTGWRIGSKG